MATPIFKDFSKANKDLLTKSFIFDQEKKAKNTAAFELKTTTSDGVEFTNTVDVSGTTLENTLTAKFNNKEYGVNFEAKGSTAKAYETTIKADQLGVKGLTAILLAKLNEGKTPAEKEANVGFEFVQEQGKFKFNFESFKSKVTTSFVSAPVSGFSVGAEVASTLDRADSEYNVGLSYAAAGAVTTLTTESVKTTDDKKKTVNVPAGLVALSYFTNVNKATKVGGKFGYTLATKAVTFDFAGQYQVDPNSVVKARVNASGDVLAHYQVNLATQVRLGVTGLFNVADVNSNKNKLGFALNFGEF